MIEWWGSMSVVEQVFATIGIASAVLLVIQVVLLAIGFGGDSDAGGAHMDAGTDGDVSVDVHDGSVGIDIDISDGVDVHAGDWYGSDMPASHVYPHTDAAETGGTGLRLFTLQGLVTFFAVFGWSGLVMLQADMHSVASVALALVFGFAAMFLIALLFRSMLRLQQDGSMDIRNALGKSGTVYMNVPPKREQKGKVSILLQEQLVELDAVTDDEEPIKTGAEVTVVGISNNNSLIVRKK